MSAAVRDGAGIQTTEPDVRAMIPSPRGKMAFIRYVPADTLAEDDRVADPDNIIQVHAVHPAVMRQHWELYKQVMHRPGPLSRRERELIGVRVSALNSCHY